MDSKSFLSKPNLKIIISSDTGFCCNFKKSVTINCNEEFKNYLSCKPALLTKFNKYVGFISTPLWISFLLVEILLLLARKDRFLFCIFDLLKLIHILSLLYFDIIWMGKELGFLYDDWINSLYCRILAEIYQVSYMASNISVTLHIIATARQLTFMVKTKQYFFKYISVAVWACVFLFTLKIFASKASYSRMCLLCANVPHALTLFIIVTVFTLLAIMQVISLISIYKVAVYMKKARTNARRKKNKAWQDIIIKFGLIWAFNFASLLFYRLTLSFHYINNEFLVELTTYYPLGDRGRPTGYCRSDVRPSVVRPSSVRHPHF